MSIVILTMFTVLSLMSARFWFLQEISERPQSEAKVSAPDNKQFCWGRCVYL